MLLLSYMESQDLTKQHDKARCHLAACTGLLLPVRHPKGHDLGTLTLLAGLFIKQDTLVIRG